jgi:hypothetical protein
MLLPPAVKAFLKELESDLEQVLRLDVEARRPDSSLEIIKWLDRSRNWHRGPSRMMGIRAFFIDGKIFSNYDVIILFNQFFFHHLSSSIIFSFSTFFHCGKL